MWLDTVVTKMLMDEPPILGQWADRAECRGHPTSWWFPEESRKNAAESNTAKAICRSCPVMSECLEYAMQYPTNYMALQGIWGGLTVSGRRKLEAERYWIQLTSREDP